MKPVRAGAVVFLTLLASTVGLPADEPRESGVTEQVDVELVLLDVTIVDKRRDIVMGLTKDDFVLKVDNRRRPIVSVDMDCPEAPVAEPDAVDIGVVAADWVAPDRERTVVLALDYRHLEQTQRVDVLESVRDAVRRLHRSRERLMIVALTEFLRVELPPTTDGEAALATLERMEHDISLWLPPFDHLHDLPTFEALLQLTDLLGTLDGDKLVVLFSNWPGSGFNYDVFFETLTTRANRRDVTFYPVWTRGLRPRGTSRRLARLASETGGRFTERTNDFSLAYARAQRDSSCRYTIGFHDSNKEPDRARRVNLVVERRGVRVFHPELYAPADPAEDPGRLAEAALAWPELNASASMSVALLPIRPLSRRRWEAVFAIELAEPDRAPVRLRASLRRGNRRWTRAEETRMAPSSVSEAIRLGHGSYVSAATVLYAGDGRPRGATSEVDLPLLPDAAGWWVSDPLVLRSMGPGRPAATSLEGTALEDDPLQGRVPVLLRADVGDSLSTLHTVCRHGDTPEDTTVEVRVTLRAGRRPAFDSGRSLRFPAGKGVRCEELDADLPALPAGAYEATLRVRTQGRVEFTRSRSFDVVEP